MSFFHLSAPDLLLGWDSDPATRNVVGLIQKYPDIARKGIRLRKYGQEVIKTTGGRKIHPDFPVPGGVNKADWTNSDPAITAKLASLGRASVPTYVLYPAAAGSAADVLPAVLTKGLVLAAIERDAEDRGIAALWVTSDGTVATSEAFAPYVIWSQT